MKLTLRIAMPVALLAALHLAGATPALAAPLTGPWTVAPGQGDGPITNENTASPTVGDGTANSADGEMFDSPFAPITLANSGEKVVFTGSMTLTGTVNSPASSGTPRTQFRFGMFDGDEDGPDDNGWVGYYMSNKHGNAGTPAGVLAEKPVGNTSVYLSATGQTVLASVQGDGTAASLFNDDTFALKFSIERSGNDLIVSGLLTGANGFSQSLSFTDTTPASYTFDHVGFLLGGNLDTDQAQFSNLDVSLVPEPATWLLGLGAMTLTTLHHRRKRWSDAN